MILIVIKASYIIIFGFDVTVVLTNEIISTVFLMFHHTIVSFKGEKILGYLLIVPSLHRVHHATERHQHDNNYSTVLSIWDRLFGTLVELEPKTIGITGRVPHDVIGLLKFGFGIEPPKPKHCTNPAVLEKMIAEAAYYKAEKRNFTPDHEIHDWLEAKIEIVGQVHGDKDSTVFVNSTPDVLKRSGSLIASFIRSVEKKQPIDYLYLR